MNNKIVLTKPVFEWLIEHLVFIEENGDNLASLYYPDLPAEQESMKKFFTEYIRKIEGELERIVTLDSIRSFRSADCLNEFPFVIIGSRIHVTDLSDQSNTSYKLIHPTEHNNRKSEITYLSALGRALLLKEKGSEVSAGMPSGLKTYKIMSITLL